MRVWKVVLAGVECFVRTTKRSRARCLAASSFAEAGYGTVGDGLARVASCRLHHGGEAGREGCWTADGLRSTTEAS